jgi:Zn-dependent oligopeptidase
LIPIVKNRGRKEYDLLLKISNKTYLYDYDISYYSTMYKKKYLTIDDNIIKEYFSAKYSIYRIITIYSRLFAIKCKKIKKFETYAEISPIHLYKVFNKEDNQLLGYFYLDLYPREGKFTHAATFDLQNTYKDINDKRIIPITAIVCNFSSDGFFTFNEIVTFCHEFGHALHNILSDVKYECLSGISMESDFGEAPSQFFENWAYKPDFLRKISKHYKSGESLPNKIIKNIKKNRYYNIGLHYLTQILYIKYDLIIHQQKNVNKDYIRNLWLSLSEELLPYKVSKNTYPMCRFDHLIGYEAGYYGYLWSIIYSYDAFSLFEKEGIYNKELGMRFRREILEKGGTVPSLEMLENFLQRKTNNKSFFDIFKNLEI